MQQTIPHHLVIYLLSLAMKVLDPNSVVRESEFKTVADAAPLLVRLGFSADKIEAMTAQNKLTDAQRSRCCWNCTSIL